MPTSIATLITCYNRRQKTQTCLEALFNQNLPSEVALTVYLVDDGSTDGTGEAVRQAWPNVKLIQGDGSLFWNGGMRRAFDEAVKDDPDYYFWLNDDTLLYPDALGTMLATSRRLAGQGCERAIVTGSTCDPQTGTHTYGGLVRSSWWHPLRLRRLAPSQEAQPCETMHGNCVLIPREVARVVGNLEPAFVHYLGDFDYGLRARKQGCTVWIAPGYQATCLANNSAHGEAWQDTSMSLGDRLKKVAQPKGFAPNESKVFVQRHTGLLWPFYWALPYVRLFLISALRRPVGYRG
jgi:GT2 family glycosyltransferase